MNIYSYPVTITNEELKNECGIDLAAEYPNGKDRRFMNNVLRAVYNGCIYVTGLADIKNRIIQADETAVAAIKQALLAQAEYLDSVGDIGTESGLTITQDGQKAVVSRLDLRSKTICSAALDALRACNVPLLYAGEEL